MHQGAPTTFPTRGGVPLVKVRVRPIGLPDEACSSSCKAVRADASTRMIGAAILYDGDRLSSRGACELTDRKHFFSGAERSLDSRVCDNKERAVGLRVGR